MTLLSLRTFAQDTTQTALILIKKGHEYKEREYMGVYNKNGFALVQDYCYQFKTSKSPKVNVCRLIKIKADSLFYTTAFNKANADLIGIPFDTIGVRFSEIEYIRLITDATLGMAKKIRFNEHDISVKTIKGNYTSPIKVKLYQIPDQVTLCYGFPEWSGVSYVYEYKGQIGYMTGRLSNTK